jgi:hypothetical protein
MNPSPGWLSYFACMFDFILENWAAILVAAMLFMKTVLNMVPSPEGDKPRQVFGYLDLLVDAIISNNTKKKS